MNGLYQIINPRARQPSLFREQNLLALNFSMIQNLIQTSLGNNVFSQFSLVIQITKVN